MDNFKSPAPRGSQDRRSVLDRILDTPHLEHVVPRLQPDLLHRVIQSCGLDAKRTGSWEAIVAILISLDAEYPDSFQQVMRGCRALSNSGREPDGLDDVLAEEHQSMFDLALDRERRRDEQGYVTPAQARAFLRMSRRLRLGSGAI